jgi:hypothetical protein
MLAATPPIGWNSWNLFGSKVNKKAVRGTADLGAELAQHVQPHQTALLKVSG